MRVIKPQNMDISQVNFIFSYKAFIDYVLIANIDHMKRI